MQVYRAGEGICEEELSGCEGSLHGRGRGRRREAAEKRVIAVVLSVVRVLRRVGEAGEAVVSFERVDEHEGFFSGVASEASGPVVEDTERGGRAGMGGRAGFW